MLSKNPLKSISYKQTRSFLLVTSILLFCFIISGCHRDKNTFQGYIEGKYTYISTPVSGELEELLVDRGNQIKKGQLLYKLELQPEITQLHQAEQSLAQSKYYLADYKIGARETIIKALLAQRSQAEANLDLSEKNLDRYRRLYKKSVIDKATLDREEANYEVNLERLKEIKANLAEAKLGQRRNLIAAKEAEVASYKAGVERTRWLLEQKTVYSPVTAQVFDTLYRVGEYVNVGSPVVILLPPNELKVIFFVPEKILVRIRVGKKILFSCTACKEPAMAKISYISKEAEYTPPVIFSKDSRDKLVYRVEARLDEKTAEQFHPGQPVDVKIEN